MKKQTTVRTEDDNSTFSETKKTTTERDGEVERTEVTRVSHDNDDADDVEEETTYEEDITIEEED